MFNNTIEHKRTTIHQPTLPNTISCTEQVWGVSRQSSPDLTTLISLAKWRTDQQIIQRCWSTKKRISLRDSVLDFPRPQPLKTNVNLSLFAWLFIAKKNSAQAIYSPRTLPTISDYSPQKISSWPVPTSAASFVIYFVAATYMSQRVDLI